MFASMWDRFSEDPGGFLLLGAAIAVVFLVIERVLRTLWRRREMEENNLDIYRAGPWNAGLEPFPAR